MFGTKQVTKNQQTKVNHTQAEHKETKAQVGWAIGHLLQQQGSGIDYTRLSDALSRIGREPKHIHDLVPLFDVLGLDKNPPLMPEPDRVYLPLLAHTDEQGWGVITDQKPNGAWVFMQADGEHLLVAETFQGKIARVQPTGFNAAQKQTTFRQLLKSNILSFKSVIVEAVFASFFINLLALAVSLFSMQVYDRVIPTRSDYTLIILASGVALVILLEMIMKFARSKIMDKVVVGLDQRLSREVFQRLLNVRVDQMPGSVGSMAAQLRGYEQVRSFYTASTLFALVDLPMGILFILLIAAIGSPIVAAVPLTAAIIAVTYGLYTRKKIDDLASEGAAASYRKTGILVEAVEGVETIKAGSGGWKFLSRWLDVMDITTQNDLDMRHANDYLSYGSQMLQQTSYVGIVIMGAYVVMSGEMTMGGLIACSILGGRVLAPVMAIPNLLVQHSHARAAEKNIESLFALEQDNHGVARPLAPSRINGHYYCDSLQFNYGENENPALNIAQLEVKPGERIGVLGPIGSGKSTLLRVLSGLYAPTAGRVLLDGLDLSQISRETISQQVGYLQQDHRLFQGTLRENLLIGMPDPGDDVLQEAMHKSGLINLVASHSSGLDLPIMEGGKGLSGGQKQLVAFTRLLLSKPSVFLLDEPTASMDDRQEMRCINVLKDELAEHKTLVVATHKMPLLQLVNRLIIIAGNKVIMDGPRDEVLKRLQENSITAKPPAQQPQQQKAGEKIVPTVTYAKKPTNTHQTKHDNL